MAGRWPILALMLALLVVTSGVAPVHAMARAPIAAAAAAPLAQGRDSVKYGYVAILPNAPMFIAVERGYFGDQGLDVEMVPFDSGALMVAPAAAGQLDMITGVPGPGLFNALARDINLKIVAAQSQAPSIVVVRKELFDSGQVRTLTDLRGLRVGFNVEGSPNDYAMRLGLQRVGIGMQDVDVQRVANSDQAAALANGALDASITVEPVPVLIESRGIGVRLIDLSDLIGSPETSFMVAGPSLLSRPDGVATRYLVAYMRGLRDYVTSVRDGRVGDPQVLEILSKWTNIPAAVIAQSTPQRVDPSGRVNLDDLNRQQDFWVRESQVPVPVDLSRFVEYRYLEAATPLLQ
jgi:NitT/TauT family transport system substrate-binding protein